MRLKTHETKYMSAPQGLKRRAESRRRADAGLAGFGQQRMERAHWEDREKTGGGPPAPGCRAA